MIVDISFQDYATQVDATGTSLSLDKFSPHRCPAETQSVQDLMRLLYVYVPLLYSLPRELSTVPWLGAGPFPVRPDPPQALHLGPYDIGHLPLASDVLILGRAWLENGLVNTALAVRRGGCRKSLQNCSGGQDMGCDRICLTWMV